MAPEPVQALETFHKDCQRLVLVAEKWLAWPAAVVEDIAAVAVEGTVAAASAAAGTVGDTFAEGLKQGEEVAAASAAAAAADKPVDQLDKPGTVDQLRQL